MEESKKVTEATLSKFQTLTVDKDGNEMLLKDVSYNNACNWLEKELAKAGSKVVDTEIKGDKTIIKADNKTKFEYDEDKGTLKRLEEAEAKITESEIKLEYKPVELGDTGENSWNTVSVYDDGLAEQSILALLDKRKIYELNYENGKKQLVKIYGVEWGSTAQCEDVLSGEQFKVDIKDMLQDGRVYETDYVKENKKVTEARRSNKRLDYKLDGFKGVTISVVDKKNGIDTEDYFKFDSMEYGIDEYEFKDNMISGIKDVLTNLYEFSDAYYDDVFTEDEINEMAEDITQDVLQLYDDLPEEKIDRKNGYAILNNNKPITEADKEIWNKVEKIVDLVDTEIEPDSNDEFDYDEHITFVFYRDLENIDIYEVYTYLDGEIQEDLDTGDVHISDLDSTLVDIVKKLKEVN